MGSPFDASDEEDVLQEGEDAVSLPPRAAEADAAMAAAKARLLARIGAASGDGGGAAEPEAVVLAGRYRIGRRLGTGGMGEVYEATCLATETKVAVKRMRPDVARHEATRRRFLREAKTSAALEHPNIVRVIDVGEDDDGLPFLVMEYIHGRTLAERMADDGPLSWSRAREVFVPVARALAYAHEAGIVHRDLKPSNIMLRAEDGSPVVIDFGLARREVLDSATMSLSRTGEILGSPPYMSPEQFRGSDVDARTDQYAFGCILYEALTGRRPFEGSDVAELMYGHLFLTPPTPEGIDAPPKVAAALSSIVQRCLRKHPDDRFADVAELAEHLARVDRDPVPVFVPADRPSLPPATRPERRSRLLWLAPLVAGAVAGLVFVAVGPWRDGPHEPAPLPATTEGPNPNHAPATTPAPGTSPHLAPDGVPSASAPTTRPAASQATDPHREGNALSPDDPSTADSAPRTTGRARAGSRRRPPNRSKRKARPRRTTGKTGESPSAPTDGSKPPEAADRSEPPGPRKLPPNPFGPQVP